MNRAVKEILRYLIMLFAFLIMAAGTVLVVQAGLGAPPWDVFHLALTAYLPLTFGQVIQGIGLLAIIISWLLKVKPGLGTLLNMYFIGLFVDLIIRWGIMPRPEALGLQLLQLAGGTFIFAYGTAMYISLNRGAGPRDSLMVAISRLTGLKLGLVRSLLEIAATISGYLLGGPLGAGTIIFALGMGPSLEGSFLLQNRQRRLLRRRLLAGRKVQG